MNSNNNKKLHNKSKIKTKYYFQRKPGIYNYPKLIVNNFYRTVKTDFKMYFIIYFYDRVIHIK